MNIRREYDVIVDSKNRVALQSPQYDFFHVREYADGRIILEPQIPQALGMPDKAMRELESGCQPEPLDFSFWDIRRK